MSRNIPNIIAGAKRKLRPTSIKQNVTRYRAFNKYHTGLKKLVWVLNGEIEDSQKKYLIAVSKQQGRSFDEKTVLPKYTDEEVVKLKKAVALLEDVFRRENFNENTQILIKKVEDYDRSKQNG